MTLDPQAYGDRIGNPGHSAVSAASREAATLPQHSPLRKGTRPCPLNKSNHQTAASGSCNSWTSGAPSTSSDHWCVAKDALRDNEDHETWSKTVATVQRAIREKVLESYRNGQKDRADLNSVIGRGLALPPFSFCSQHIAAMGTRRAPTIPTQY